MIKQYSVTFVLHYSTFLYNYLIYIALKLMFVRYKKLSEELFQFFNTAQHRRVNSLSNFLNRNRSTLVDLKETSDLINDVFGWPILLIIFSAYQQILVYLDVVVNNPQNRPLDVVLLNVTTILIVWVGNVTILLFCDSVVKEREKILTESYRLQTRATRDDQEQLWKFIAVIKDNVPEFSAAGFFSLNKSMILQILDSLITMLIVMIQLR
ncbi:hypothetical protein MTP99_004179 [Tenebrio molitor]|nr:hypothetical protein MTP99_004179 [Tenebrio molitor]